MRRVDDLAPVQNIVGIGFISRNAIDQTSALTRRASGIYIYSRSGTDLDTAIYCNIDMQMGIKPYSTV